MKRYLLLAVLPVILLFGCAQENDPVQVVRDYYRAMETEDVKLYMSTVSGPRADAAGDYLEKYFTNYDVQYTIDTIGLLSKIGNEAQVLSIVTARDAGGPKKFTNNRVTVLNFLRKHNNSWTIYDSEVSNLIKLDADGNPIVPEAPKDSLLWKSTLPTG